MNNEILIIKKRRGGTRELLPHQYWFNRHTPVGEDAEIWERKPYGGRKEILWSEVVGRRPAKGELNK